MQLENNRCYPLAIDVGALAHYSHTLCLPSTTAALMALAHVIAANPVWRKVLDVRLVVRVRPKPVLAILGDFDEITVSIASALARKLSGIVARLRYIDYAQAERDCEHLAARLTARFGRDEVRRFHYTAIPRGGFVVLGMLAYILGLEYEQLIPPHPPDVPLVIVDDCSLTGTRFKDALAHCESEQVVFAPLYAHPELRATIEDKESRVVACVSARDLNNHVSTLQSDEYDLWRKRWLAKFGERCYWVGQTEHLCFAWNEPDHVIYTADGKDLGNWQIVPPELCLKNRSRSDGDPIPVQIQPKGRGPLRPSDRVIYGELDSQITVGDLETRATFGLADVAADMWRTIVTYGTLDKAVEVLLREYDVGENALRADLQVFVDDLLERGLLEGAL